MDGNERGGTETLRRPGVTKVPGKPREQGKFFSRNTGMKIWYGTKVAAKYGSYALGILGLISIGWRVYKGVGFWASIKQGAGVGPLDLG